MNDRELMQQALEAIEHHGGHLPWAAFVEVRADLRAALAEPTVTVRYDLGATETDEAIRQRLIELGWTPPKAEQPAEQEPVAWPNALAQGPGGSSPGPAGAEG